MTIKYPPIQQELFTGGLHPIAIHTAPIVIPAQLPHSTVSLQLAILLHFIEILLHPLNDHRSDFNIDPHQPDLDALHETTIYSLKGGL